MLTVMLTLGSFLESSATDNKPSQKNTALLFLTAIIQAYVWEDPDHPAQVVPAVLTQNVFPLCKKMQRFPVITYADYILHNWKRINTNGPLTLDNIEPIVTFTGTSDEAWFIKIHVVIEAICAAALNAAYEARKAIKQSGDESIENECLNKIINALNKIQQSITQAINLMHKMQDGCNPGVFWDKLRPFLNGWEKVHPNEMEVGVRFEGLATKDKLPMVFAGPSGAQSGIIPALDAALGIKHNVDSMYRKLLEFQSYMPRSHQVHVFKLQDAHIRGYTKKSDSEALHLAYDAAVKAVQKFRGAHLQLVHQYIYQPAQQQGIQYNQITGTGGAPINAYLSGRYIETGESRSITRPKL